MIELSAWLRNVNTSSWVFLLATVTSIVYDRRRAL